MAFSVTGGYAVYRILIRQSLVEEVNAENVLTYNVYKYEINPSQLVACLGSCPIDLGTDRHQDYLLADVHSANPSNKEEN